MTTIRPFTAAAPDYDGGLFYPSEDGPDEPARDAVPMARRLIREALEDYFALELEVFVGARLPWYADRGRLLCRPDAFVAFVARSEERTAWRLEQERVTPAVCIHVETRANRAAVFGAFKDRCEGLGVKEYLVFHSDRVTGFHLQGGRYRGIRRDSDDGIRSRRLGLRLVSEYGYPRFVDVTTGEVVLTRREQALRSVRARRAAAES